MLGLGQGQSQVITLEQRNVYFRDPRFLWFKVPRSSYHALSDSHQMPWNLSRTFNNSHIDCQQSREVASLQCCGLRRASECRWKPSDERIYTELFIDRMAALYIVNGRINDESSEGGQPLVPVDPLKYQKGKLKK